MALSSRTIDIFFSTPKPGCLRSSGARGPHREGNATDPRYAIEELIAGACSVVLPTLSSVNQLQEERGLLVTLPQSLVVVNLRESAWRSVGGRYCNQAQE